MRYDHKTPKEQKLIEERQKKEVTGESETYVLTRSADHSPFARVSQFIDKYKILWYLIVGIALALGFKFKTPGMYYDEMTARVDQLSKNAAIADRKIDVLITFKCLEQSDRDMRIAGIDCDKYINLNTQRSR